MQVLGALLVTVLVQSALAISGGKMALPGLCPYQALVRPEGKGSFCSGALISNEWVLTSASCISGARVFEVTVGAFDLSLPAEDTRVVLRGDNPILAEDWRAETGKNDLGLIRVALAKHLISAFVAPIRLPSKQQADKSFLTWDGVASGWGYISDDDKTNGYWIMRSFNARVEPNAWCKVRVGFNKIDDSKICVSSLFSKRGTCEGDSGTPLAVTEKDGQPTLVGIASNDAESCGNMKPAVFTRIGAYLDWISAATGIALRE